MKQYKVVIHVDRQVAERGDKGIQLIVLRRAGGPNDSVIPRYYAGLGKTRDWAILQAKIACREHGEFDPVIVPAKQPVRRRIPAREGV